MPPTNCATHVLGGMGWQQPRLAMRLVDELPAGETRDREMQRTANRIVNGGVNVSVIDGLLTEASPEWREALLNAGFMTLRPEYFHDAPMWLTRLEELNSENRSGGCIGAGAGLDSR